MGGKKAHGKMLSTIKMQIKTIVNIATHILEHLLKRRTVPRTGKDVEQLQLSHTAGRNAKWKTSWQFLKKLNVHLPSFYSYVFYVLPKRNESLCSYKDLYLKIPHCLIYNSQKLKAIQMSIMR